MSRDLHDFAMLLAQGGTNVANIIMKGQENRERAAYRLAQMQAAARREAIADRRDRREELKTGQYIRESESRIAKRAGGGAGAGAGAPSDGLNQINEIAAGAGVAPPQSQTIRVEGMQSTDNGTPLPPGETNYGGDGGGGFSGAADVDYGMRRGGRVRAFEDGGVVFGTSGPGSGRGTRAARPPGYVAGMKRGGRVQKFEGGGMPYDGTIPIEGTPEPRQMYDDTTGAIFLLPPTDPVARGRAVLDSGQTVPVRERSWSIFPSVTREGRAKAVEEDKAARADRDTRRALRSQTGPTTHGMFVGETGRANERGADVRPVFYGEEARADEIRDPGETGGWPEPQAVDARPPTTPPPARTGGGGGGAPRGDQPWLPLRDQRRTAAYDPIKDAADPDNIHAVDRWGRTRPTTPLPASAPGGGRALPPAYNPEGGSGLNPQGSNSYGAGLSTGNAANDLAAHEAGVQYAGKLFHLTEGGPNSERGYHALLTGHGAATPQEMQAVFKAVDPDGRMPMDERLTRSLDAVHAFYTQQGQPEKAAKTSFEIMQFANQMAKAHGAEAIKLLGKGDVNGALQQLMGGYNWLPNGWTANVDPNGRELVLEDGKGNIAATYPINPQTIKNFALGMTTGELGWDVMRTPLTPRAAPTGAPGGAPAGGPPPAPPGRQPWDERGGAGPTVPIRPSAQPSAAPAGPAPTPAAAVDTKPPMAPGAKPAPAPTSRGKPQAEPSAPAKTSGTPGEGKPPEIKLDEDGVPDIIHRRTEGVHDVERMVAEKYGARVNAINKIYATLPKGERAAANRTIAALNKEIDTYRNDLLRRRHENDGAERQGLQPRVPTDQTVTSINQGAEARFAAWRNGAAGKDKNFDPKEAAEHVDRSALKFLDTPDKRKGMVNIARNIRLRNHDLDNDQAADVAMQMTKNSAQVKVLGRDLANNVVVRVNIQGTPVSVHMPRSDFRQLIQLRNRGAQEKAASEAEVKRKADEAKKREQDLGKGSGLIPNMTPSLFLPM